MAITKKNTNSLIETGIGTEITAGKVVTDVKPSGPAGKIPSVDKAEKKSGFIKNNIEELKKVEWPSVGYFLRWAGVIVLFTGIFSLILGSVDTVFSSALKYVDCTSSQGKNQDLKTCGGEFVQNLSKRV